MRRVLATTVILMLVFSSSPLLSPNVNAIIMPTLSAWASAIPTIDGVISPGEWDDAAKVNFTLTYNVPQNPTQSTFPLTTESHECTFYVKNDETYLYLAIIVRDEDYSDGDVIEIHFDNNHNGIRETGDEVLSSLYGDGQWIDGGWGADVSFGGIDNLLFARTHTNPNGIGDWSFEFRQPLDSDDNEHDFSLSTGDIVGFAILYIDFVPTPEHPTAGWGSTFPDQGPSPIDASKFAYILIAYPPTTPDFEISVSPGFSSAATLYVPVDSSYSHKAFYNLTVTSLNGFSDVVSLDVSGIPYGITYSFYPSSLVPTMWSILELTSSVEAFLSIGFSTEKFTITITATGGGKTHSLEVSLTVSIPSAIPTLKTAVLIDPTTSKTSSVPEVITKISRYLKDGGYDVYYVRGTDVTVEWLRTGLKQGVIFWRGHGDSVLSTGELVDSVTEARYRDDFESGRIMKTSAQYWGITPEFIRYYYKFNSFPYSLVFVEACSTLKVPSFAEAFTTRGAGAYIGYKDVVNPTYPLWWWSGDYQAEQAFYNFLYKGYSVAQVVNDLHRWYDPLCSLAWYGNWELKLTEYWISVKSLGVSVHSPAHIYVTDPLGRHIGFDPATVAIVNEIPEAIYTDPSLWADIEVVWIPQSLEGNYEIRLLGTDTGSFTLIVGLETITHVYMGTILSGQVLELTGTISEEELISTTPSHTPTSVMANKYRMVEYVKFELQWATFVVNETVTESDVKESLLDKLTTSILKVNQAIDWIESDRDKVANNMLNAAKNVIAALNHEIKAQSDKSIPEYLANDLITVFQGIIQDIETARSLT